MSFADATNMDEAIRLVAQTEQSMIPVAVAILIASLGLWIAKRMMMDFRHD